MHMNDALHLAVSGPHKEARLAFHALLGFPGEETIEGANAEQLVGALAAVAQRLRSDRDIMPGQFVDLVQDSMGSGTLPAPTYSACAAAVIQHIGWWRSYYEAKAPKMERRPTLPRRPAA